MKNDEFAFFNQQLAAMLRDGIPLEGALRRLCEEMRRGKLRDELQLLEADLAKGTPIADALAARQLPELYKQMVLVGVKSGDLPGALTMLADYFHRQNNLWTRLKGLMVYPLIVLFVALLLSCFLSLILAKFIWPNFALLTDGFTPPVIAVGIWTPPIFLGLTAIVVFVGAAMPRVRRFLRWRLPAFRETSLAQIASAMQLMLKSGMSLDNSLALVERFESGTPAGRELANWRHRLASGQGKFPEIAQPNGMFPPLFIWLISNADDDLAGGFQRAAEIYQSRASYRADTLLYSALPCSILLLALLIMSQIQPVFAALATYMQMLGDVSG